MLSVHFLEAAPVCDPVCEGDAVCADGGVCNCGDAPCNPGQVCNGGNCGMYLKLSDANKLINTEITTENTR